MCEEKKKSNHVCCYLDWVKSAEWKKGERVVCHIGTWRLLSARVMKVVSDAIVQPYTLSSVECLPAASRKYQDIKHFISCHIMKKDGT